MKISKPINSIIEILETKETEPFYQPQLFHETVKKSVEQIIDFLSYQKETSNQLLTLFTQENNFFTAQNFAYENEAKSLAEAIFVRAEEQQKITPLEQAVLNSYLNYKKQKMIRSGLSILPEEILGMSENLKTLFEGNSDTQGKVKKIEQPSQEYFVDLVSKGTLLQEFSKSDIVNMNHQKMINSDLLIELLKKGEQEKFLVEAIVNMPFQDKKSSLVPGIFIDFNSLFVKREKRDGFRFNFELASEITKMKKGGESVYVFSDKAPSEIREEFEKIKELFGFNSSRINFIYTHQLYEPNLIFTGAIISEKKDNDSIQVLSEHIFQNSKNRISPVLTTQETQGISFMKNTSIEQDQVNKKKIAEQFVGSFGASPTTLLFHPSFRGR